MIKAPIEGVAVDVLSPERFDVYVTLGFGGPCVWVIN